MKIKKEWVILLIFIMALVFVVFFAPKPRLAPPAYCERYTCTNWEDQSCGSGSCASLEMLQTRECTHTKSDVNGSDDEPEIHQEETEAPISLSPPPPECTQQCVLMEAECNSLPAQPSNPDPLDSSSNIDLDPTLSWTCTDPENDLLTYDVYFGDCPTPSLPPIATGLTDSNFNPGTLNYGTEYCWYVIADDGFDTVTGPTWSFTTEDNQLPEIPTLIFPGNSAIDITIYPTLSWTCTDTENDLLTYDIYFGTDSNPPLVLSNHPNIEYTSSTLDYSETYYWKIVAKDAYGESISSIWSFMTESPPNSPPIIHDPILESGSIDLPLEVLLHWNVTDPDDDPLTYDIYFDDIEPPGLHMLDYSVGTNLTISGLGYSETYYWRIMAKDDQGHNVLSSIWSFTTAAEQDSPPDKKGGGGSSGGNWQSTTLTPLFDIKVFVIDESQKIFQGDKVKAEIVLYNFGTLRPADVFLECSLEDMETNKLDEFTETLAVDLQTSIIREMYTLKDIELGKYVYTCYLTYGNETILSSDLFQVIDRTEPIEEKPFEFPIFWLLIIAAIIMLAAWFRIIYKGSKRNKKKWKKRQ